MRQLTATGFWPLYRFDPAGRMKVSSRWRWTLARRRTRWRTTLLNEQRFRRLNAQQPEVAEQLWRMPQPICKNAMSSLRRWPVKRRSPPSKANLYRA
ncbi:Uncharacterised protein [Raoultella terrigena]|uniref:Uncharacterized protein n=1 Tax=Raoultella terrigena TaxID=577 RepID=A0A4V6J163_RAOTE|nr:Uncharacterised protein [Raoultella terrigena]